MCWNVGTLRRIFYALPFLAVAFIGLGDLRLALLRAGLPPRRPRPRASSFALIAPAQLIGLLLTTRIITRLFVKSATLVPRFVAGVEPRGRGRRGPRSRCSPNLVVAVILNALVTGIVVLIVPPIFAALSLAIPPKIRSFGFAVASLWILPGLLLLPVVGALADEWGIRTGLILMVPVFLVGAMVVASAGKEIEKDIKRVWTSAAAQSEVLYERRQGRAKLLLVRGVSVHYGAVQVLFDVDLEVDEGEIVALLGTNGAGQVDAAEGDRRARRADRGRDRLRRPRHELHAAGRDRGARRDDGAGRRRACSRR